MVSSEARVMSVGGGSGGGGEAKEAITNVSSTE